MRECSFCATMTLSIAKYNVSKECFRQFVITSRSGDWRSIFTHEHSQRRSSTRRRSVLLKTNSLPGLAGCASTTPAVSSTETINTLTNASFRLRPCPRIGSQPIHTTSLLKLDSVASELVEYRSTSANVMMLPLSHTCPADMMNLCSPVSLGAI